MIHIAIVDDQKEERQSLREALGYVAEQRKVEFVIDEYDSAASFLFHFKCQFDLVFMDIEMGSEDGIHAAHEMRKLDSEVILIFVTKMAQYALKGYEVDALDFIVKPVQSEEFLLKMTRPLSRIRLRESHSSVLINTNGNVHSIRCESILCLLVHDHYVTYHTTQGDLDEYISLRAAYKKVEQERMVPCNRNIVVNLRYVTAIQNGFCLLQDGTKLEISRSQRKEFLSDFVNYLGGQS